MAFSGCQPVAVIKESLITAVDGKATTYRAEYGREPYDREGNLDVKLSVSFSDIIKHFFIFIRKTC